MTEALLRYGDRELKLPVVAGTEDEAGLDISHLSAETGLFTLDRGFGNTAEGQSAVTYIDGDEGILRHRGYPIEQLA